MSTNLLFEGLHEVHFLQKHSMLDKCKSHRSTPDQFLEHKPITSSLYNIMSVYFIFNAYTQKEIK